MQLSIVKLQQYQNPACCYPQSYDCMVIERLSGCSFRKMERNAAKYPAGDNNSRRCSPVAFMIAYMASACIQLACCMTVSSILQDCRVRLIQLLSSSAQTLYLQRCAGVPARSTLPTNLRHKHSPGTPELLNRRDPLLQGNVSALLPMYSRFSRTNICRGGRLLSG